MRSLSLVNLTVVGLVSAAAGALITYAARLRAGSYLLVTPFMAILFISVAVMLWYWGRKVVAYKEKRSYMDISSAVNVAYLAYSTAWTGAICGGGLAGSILPMLPTLESTFAQEAAWRAGITALAALVMTIVAVIVERWCRRDENEDGAWREGLEPEAS